MYKIGAIGDKDSVLGFKVLGVEVFYHFTNINELIHTMVQDDYAIILIIEQFLEEAAPAIARYEDSPIPAIIPVPDIRGSKGIGMQNIRKAAEKAIGADILFQDR